MKTVLVTGSSRGIGKEIAKEFAKHNWNVVINCRSNPKEGEALANELASSGADCMFVQADVSDSKQVAKMFELVNKRYGHVDCLINNAGVAQQKLLLDTTDEDYTRIVDVNLKGTIICTREVLKKMKDFGGSIVNLSSILGVVGGGMESLYATSKAGVIGLTKSVAKEMGHMGIRVNAIAPGFIETDMTKPLPTETKQFFKENTTLGRLGTPNDIAKLAYFLGSDDSSFITAQVIQCDGGWI